MLHLRDLFFFFFSILILINCIINLMNREMLVFVAYFLEFGILFLENNVDEEYE